MPDTKTSQNKPKVLVVNTAPVMADELIRKVNQNGLSRINTTSLQQTLGNSVIVAPTKYQLKLSCRQTWVENKGELRLFGSDMMHPGENIAVFSNEASTQEKFLLVWLYGLTKKKDYSVQFKLQAYPQQLDGPAFNEPGSFRVLANGNDFTVKPTYKEQIIPISLLSVHNTETLIMVFGIDLRQWSFREITAKEVDL